MAAKSGRNLGDIFSSTTPATSKKKIGQAEAAVAKYLAPMEAEAVQKVTTFFTQDQLDYLDGQSREIKRNTGKSLKRTTILRALVQGLMMESVNLGTYGSEEALAEAFSKRMPLKGGKL
jgi:hypothetical protein